MTSTILFFSICAGLITFLGGLFSLKFRSWAHLITSFSAGVVIGLAFFDLLPEAIELSGQDTSIVTGLIAIGFVIYLILDRAFNKRSEHNIHNGNRGTLRAGSLVMHSFFDGLAIGFAFQVSSSLGVLVAVAVLAHDFSDGVNTISAVLKDGGDKAKAMTFLILDSLAPVFGILFTLFFTVSQNVLGLILALFCGFFIYIGASDLIPESYHNHPTKLTTFMTIFGMIFIYLAILLAGN